MKREWTFFAISSVLSTATAFVEVRSGGIFAFLPMLLDSAGRVANMFQGKSLALGSNRTVSSLLAHFELLPADKRTADNTAGAVVSWGLFQVTHEVTNLEVKLTFFWTPSMSDKTIVDFCACKKIASWNLELFSLYWIRENRLGIFFGISALLELFTEKSLTSNIDK